MVKHGGGRFINQDRLSSEGTGCSLNYKQVHLSLDPQPSGICEKA